MLRVGLTAVRWSPSARVFSGVESGLGLCCRPDASGTGAVSGRAERRVAAGFLFQPRGHAAVAVARAEAAVCRSADEPDAAAAAAGRALAAVPAWVWMGLLFGPMAAFLALLLVRAAKLPHPLGKLLSLPAALPCSSSGSCRAFCTSSVCSRWPHRCRSSPETSIPSLTPSLLGLSVSALPQSTCPEPPEIRSVQPAVV